jgi:hypothetical protein
MLYVTPMSTIGITPKYDLSSGVEEGRIKNNTWHRVSEVVDSKQKLTLCPIRSETAPKHGAKNAEIKKTLLVIRPASV